MEVSCRSPGSNSWAPFRPNSSQPRRKTDRLSWRRQQQPVSSSLEQGWFTEISVALESVSLPARRWGWAACWSSWRVLVWSHLGACVEEEERPRFIESYGSLCMLVMLETSKWYEVRSQAYSHNRMPFSNALRKSLSPKLFPVTACGRRTGKHRCKGGGWGHRVQLFA